MIHVSTKLRNGWSSEFEILNPPNWCQLLLRLDRQDSADSPGDRRRSFILDRLKAPPAGRTTAAYPATFEKSGLRRSLNAANASRASSVCKRSRNNAPSRPI